MSICNAPSGVGAGQFRLFTAISARRASDRPATMSPTGPGRNSAAANNPARTAPTRPDPIATRATGRFSPFPHRSPRKPAGIEMRVTPRPRLGCALFSHRPPRPLSARPTAGSGRRRAACRPGRPRVGGGRAGGGLVRHRRGVGLEKGSPGGWRGPQVPDRGRTAVLGQQRVLLCGEFAFRLGDGQSPAWRLRSQRAAQHHHRSEGDGLRHAVPESREGRAWKETLPKSGEFRRRQKDLAEPCLSGPHRPPRNARTGDKGPRRISAQQGVRHDRGYEPSVPGVAISKRPVLALDEDEVDHDIVTAHA
jgi:hypothetical protein